MRSAFSLSPKKPIVLAAITAGVLLNAEAAPSLDLIDNLEKNTGTLGKSLETKVRHSDATSDPQEDASYDPALRIQELTQKITAVTRQQIQNLISTDVQKNYGEIGGMVYEDATSLYFYEMENKFDSVHEKVNQFRTGDLTKLPELDAWMEKEYGEKSSSCNPAKVEEAHWFKQIIEPITIARQKIEIFKDYQRLKRSAIREYADAFTAMLDKRYAYGKLYEQHPKGNLVGYFHSHPNGTSFSNTDMCGVNDTTIKFLISHACPTSEQYALYVYYKNKEYLLKTFPINCKK